MAIQFTVDHDHTYAGDDGEEQLIGSIHFDVQTRPGDFRVRQGGASTRTINLPRRTAYLGIDGHLYKDSNADAPFRLVANDPAFNLGHLTYHVNFELTTIIGAPVGVPSTYFPAPSMDTTLQLTKVMKDPEQPVMEIRTKGYVEDILDVSAPGQVLLTAGTSSAQRDAIGMSKVFSTADYAAVSGNDRPRVAAAVAAAVAAMTSTGKDQTVLIHAPLVFTTGVTKVALSVTADPFNGAIADQGVPIPCGLAHKLNIVFGAGAKITLSATCENAFYVDKQADYDVFQNVNFYDAAVDGGNQPARSHALIGNYMGAVKLRYLSFQDINFYGKTRFTNFYWSAAGPVFAYFGIAFFGEHNTPLEATQTFSKNIHADSVHMEGGNGLFEICSQAAARSRPGGVNHYYDNITIDDYKYVAPTATTDYAKQAGTGILICGAGFGDYCRIGPGYVENVGDDALEIGAMQRVEIEQPSSKDPYYEGILLRNTHAPIDVNTQKITIRGLSCEVTTALSGTAGAFAAPIRMIVDDQVITLVSTASGGSGVFVVPGVGTTAAVNWNASAATIAAAFVNIGCTGTVASGGPLNTGMVTVKVGGVNLTAPITFTSSLTGGSLTLDLAPSNASFGTVTLEDAVFKADGLTYSKQNRLDGLFFMGLDQPHRLVEVTRPKIVLSNYTFDGSFVENIAMMHPSAPYKGWGHLIVRDYELVLVGTCDFTAGSAQGALCEIMLDGNSTILEVDGMVNDRAASVDGKLSMVVVANSASASNVRFLGRRLNPKTLAATNNYGVRLFSNGTVARFDVSDSDLSRGTDTVVTALNLSSAGSNAAIARAGRNLYPAAVAGASITVGGSPFTYQNMSGFTQFVQISGGTVSTVEYKVLNGSFHTAAVVSGIWIVEPGASLKVTYSVAPTMATVDTVAQPGLATVATSGVYADLTGKPALAPVALSGVYGDLTGKPTLGTSAAVDYNPAAAASTIPFRDAQANLLADAFIPGLTSTVTAAGTTTLTVDSTEEQTFTGSTTQIASLPTTSIVAGQRYKLSNQSAGSVTVNASGGSLVITLLSGQSAVVTALVATPTTPAHWSLGALAPVAFRATASGASVALRDGVANILANAFICELTSTPTAAGTTTLVVGSDQIQVFTGATTQTVTLPTTSVPTGLTYRMINTSSGIVTINSSAGNLVKSLAAGAWTDVTALAATPTTAAHWFAT